MTRETTGYQGLSLDAVAREAGIKKPTLYHHFPGGKETIYAEVAHDFIETQHTALAAAIATEGDLSARRVAIADHHVREDEPSFLANAFLHLARATDLDPGNPQMAHRLVALFLDGAHGNVPTTS